MQNPRDLLLKRIIDAEEKGNIPLTIITLMGIGLGGAIMITGGAIWYKKYKKDSREEELGDEDRDQLNFEQFMQDYIVTEKETVVVTHKSEGALLYNLENAPEKFDYNQLSLDDNRIKSYESATLSPDGTKIALVVVYKDSSKKVIILNVYEKSVYKEINCSFFAWSSPLEGISFAYGDKKGNIRVESKKDEYGSSDSYQKIPSPVKTEETLKKLCISANPNLIAYQVEVNNDNYAYIRNLSKGNYSSNIENASGIMAFSPDEKLFAHLTTENNIVIYEISNDKNMSLKEIFNENLKETIDQLEWSKDEVLAIRGKLDASNGSEGFVSLIRRNDEKFVKEKVTLYKNEHVCGLAWSNNKIFVYDDKSIVKVTVPDKTDKTQEKTVDNTLVNDVEVAYISSNTVRSSKYIGTE